MVEVERIGVPRIEGFFTTIEISAKPVEILFGKVAEDMVNCEYSQGRPHERGGMRVSPMVYGSGQEFQLKKGDRVIFLLADEKSLLRVEPLDKLGQIRQLSKKLGLIQRLRVE